MVHPTSRSTASEFSSLPLYKHAHNQIYPSSVQSSMNFRQSSKPAALFDPETGAELHRHPDLWFDDGSVICRAEDILFRIHISQMCRHSPFFRDMFSIGNPSNSVLGSSIYSKGGPNDFENCPLIELHDKADDVGNLFVALYDGPYVFSFHMSCIIYPLLFHQTLRKQRSRRLSCCIRGPTVIDQISCRFIT